MIPNKIQHTAVKTAVAVANATEAFFMNGEWD
jgi:hypothetical protein